MSYRRTCVIPIDPIRRVLSEWIERNSWDGVTGRNFLQYGRTVEGYGKDRVTETVIQPVTPWVRLSNDTGIRHDTLYQYVARKGKKWIEFDLADKIITAIDPTLWHSDDELSDIYQNFDFTGLDELSRVAA